MSTRQIVERKERSMIEILIIVVITGALAGVFITSFFKQEQRISAAAFNALTNAFASKVQVVHAQWMMDEQPNVVRLREINTGTEELVTVNKKGWIDTTSPSFVCQNIWLMATGAPLSFMNNPVSVIYIERAGQTGPSCKYIVVNGEQTYSFEYSPSNGKIKY